MMDRAEEFWQCWKEESGLNEGEMVKELHEEVRELKMREAYQAWCGQQQKRGGGSSEQEREWQRKTIYTNKQEEGEGIIALGTSVVIQYILDCYPEERPYQIVLRLLVRLPNEKL